MSPPKPPKGYFNLLYFAAATSFTNKDFETLPAPVSLAKLFALLEERYAGIQEAVLESSMVTINLDYVDLPATGEEGVIIQEGDEVAIIPPVSSG